MKKVLDSIAKVDKAMRAAAPRPFRTRGRGRDGRSSVRCFSYNQFGHYQNLGVRQREKKFSTRLQEQSRCDLGKWNVLGWSND